MESLDNAQACSSGRPKVLARVAQPSVVITQHRKRGTEPRLVTTCLRFQASTLYLRCPSLLQGNAQALESAVLQQREQNSAEVDEQAKSDASTSGTDGEDLAVELAKIANDVKVARS